MRDSLARSATRKFATPVCDRVSGMRVPGATLRRRGLREKGTQGVDRLERTASAREHARRARELRGRAVREWQEWEEAVAGR